MAMHPLKRIPASVNDEIATTVKDLDIFTGWLYHLENPDPVLRTESNGKGLKLYDEITRDPHASSVLQTRYLSVIGKEWEVIPAEEPKRIGRPSTTTQAQRIADFVTDTFLSINFDQFRQEILQGILYGFYCAEVIWENRNGAIVPAIIRGKHPRRFSFTMNRELRLLTPQDMIEGEKVPDRKFVIFTYGSSDNPYGQGLGQKLWWPVWFKKNGIKFWLVFLEKYGMPTAIGKYPPGTSLDQHSALLEALDAVQSETGIKIPDTMTIELLEASRQGTATYGDLCDYMDRQISKAVLGQTLTTEMGSNGGSYAASKTHNDVRQDIVKADADFLSECLNATLVQWLVDLNFPDATDYPKFWIRTEEAQTLKELADRDKILVDIGLPIARRYFYDTYAVAPPEEGEDAIASAPSRPQAADGQVSAFADFSLAEGNQAGIDSLVNEILKESGNVMAGNEKLMIEAVTSSESYDEAFGRLLDLFPSLKVDALEDALSRSLLNADLYGRWTAK